MNNTSVESYLQDGCGRCDRFRTPECKVHRRPDVLRALRALLVDTELVEEMKWGSPCYTLGGKNVVMLSALNDYCALGFFKGAILVDEDGLLEAPGPNTRLARRVSFRSVDEVAARRDAVAELIRQAIEAERTGKTAAPPQTAEPMPAELERRLEQDLALKRAFEALTPGRRRSHIIYISAAKKSETRAARVERCAPKILAGRGFHDR